MGGVIGGLALIGCLVAFVILKKRINHLEQQGRINNMSQWNDHGNKNDLLNASISSNTEPDREQNERYGAPEDLTYSNNPSANLQENN